MGDVIVTCVCGARMRASEYTIGMRVRCAKCGEPLDITEENTVPVEETDAPRPPSQPRRPGGKEGPKPGPSANAPAAAPAKGEGEGRGCKRCGRAFRGDWDQHVTSSFGVVCNICFNILKQEQALQQEDEEPPAGPVEPAGLDEYYHEPEDGRPPGAKKDLGAAEREQRTQSLVTAAGCATIIITIIMVAIYGGPPAPGETGGGPDTEELRAELPRQFRIGFLAVSFLFGYAGELAALFFCLRRAGAEPHGTVGRDLLALLAPAMAVHLMRLFLSLPNVFAATAIAHVSGLVLIKWLFGLSLGETLIYWIMRLLLGLLAYLLGVVVLYGFAAAVL